MHEGEIRFQNTRSLHFISLPPFLRKLLEDGLHQNKKAAESRKPKIQRGAGKRHDDSKGTPWLTGGGYPERPEDGGGSSKECPRR